MKKIVIILSALALLATAVPAAAGPEKLPPDPNLSGDFMAEQYKGELIIFDVFIVRPMSFAASLIGLGSSVVAYPFAAASGSTELVDRELVRKPWEYTFSRPVGDLNY